MTTRAASHAGSWYTADPKKLSAELGKWLKEVGDNVREVEPVTGQDIRDATAKAGPHAVQVANGLEWKGFPVRDARVIIAPHAGYDYSGPTAAYAYKCVDFENKKRIFLLGPSHVLSLKGCALSTHSSYATPLGDLKLDLDTIEELRSTKMFSSWRASPEEKEHSLEMHLPYIYKMLSESFKSSADYPLLIPILVGATDASDDRRYGKILASYLADPLSVFIVSSDFCHWGERFSYTYYVPSTPSSKVTGYSLELGDENPKNPAIYDSIGRIDKMAMDAIKGGKHDDFLANLKITGNTVCGRHPIAVIMAALEILEHEGKLDGEEKGRFKMVHYAQSSKVTDMRESSVSYVSAVAVL